MANKKLQGPLLAIGALLIAGAAVAFVAWRSLDDNLVYYWTPSELIAKGEKAYGPTVRLGGFVSPGSMVWNPAHTGLTFKLADSPDPGAAMVDVACNEIPPQMFRDGMGAVIEGTYDASHVFNSSRLMVKHSNEYRPPKPGEDPKQWMKSLVKEDTQAKR